MVLSFGFFGNSSIFYIWYIYWCGCGCWQWQIFGFIWRLSTPHIITKFSGGWVCVFVCLSIAIICIILMRIFVLIWKISFVKYYHSVKLHLNITQCTVIRVMARTATKKTQSETVFCLLLCNVNRYAIDIIL